MHWQNRNLCPKSIKIRPFTPSSCVICQTGLYGVMADRCDGFSYSYIIYVSRRQDAVLGGWFCKINVRQFKCDYFIRNGFSSTSFCMHSSFITFGIWNGQHMGVYKYREALRTTSILFITLFHTCQNYRWGPIRKLEIPSLQVCSDASKW